MKHFIPALIAFLMLLCCACGEETAAKDVTRTVTITASNVTKRPISALDGDYTTFWDASKNGSWIQVEFPADIAPGGIQIEWFTEPSDYEFTQYDADGNTIKSEKLADGFRSICTYFRLEPGTRSAKLACKKGSRIANMHVYSAGQLPDTVQAWEAPVQKADIMLISTHEDDEILWFGGAIPYYNTVRENDMVVVYMVSNRRLRRAEALSGLWTMGVRTYPEFLGFKDSYPSSINEGIKEWGGKTKIIGRLVEAIRRYRPEVILCQDENGEYGHRQHKITSMLIPYAVTAAADPSKYSESYEKYGAWEVKKLYRHLGSENVIYMDWSTPSDKLGGKTPLESAALGFRQHASQQKAYSMEDGKKYDNTKFSLVYTAVGEDVYRDDFLENTSADPRRTPEPTETPAPAATPEPMETATPEPVMTATALPAAAATAEPEPYAEKTGSGVLIAAGAALIAGGAGGLAYLKIRNDRRKRARRRKKKKQ